MLRSRPIIDIHRRLRRSARNDNSDGTNTQEGDYQAQNRGKKRPSAFSER